MEALKSLLILTRPLMNKENNCDILTTILSWSERFKVLLRYSKRKNDNTYVAVNGDVQTPPKDFSRVALKMNHGFHLKDSFRTIYCPISFFKELLIMLPLQATSSNATVLFM